MGFHFNLHLKLHKKTVFDKGDSKNDLISAIGIKPVKKVKPSHAWFFCFRMNSHIQPKTESETHHRNLNNNHGGVRIGVFKDSPL